MKLTSTLVALLASIMVAVPPSALADGSGKEDMCPKVQHRWTTADVLAAHVAAFESADARLVACGYADDAVFMAPGVLPSGLVQGRASIEAVFGSFFAATGGNIEVVTRTFTVSDDVALFEYAISSNHVIVSDGVDTFVVDRGLIVAHTAHLGGFATK